MLWNGSSLATPPLGFEPWGAALRTLLVDAAWPPAYFVNATIAQRLSLHLPRHSLIFQLDSRVKEVLAGIAW
jgi:hypothetical protein